MLFCSYALGTNTLTTKESYCLKLFLCTMEETMKSDSEESPFPESMATILDKGSSLLQED